MDGGVGTVYISLDLFISSSFNRFVLVPSINKSLVIFLGYT